jgi:uncharacterized protein with HEPN domain
VRFDRDRLEDIIDAIEAINRYVVEGKAAFEHDELIQTWMVHHIQVIGEASSKLSEEFRARHPDVPWANIIAMRNILVHVYFHVDLDEVWLTVTRDLPSLEMKIRKILIEDNMI